MNENTTCTEHMVGFGLICTFWSKKQKQNSAKCTDSNLNYLGWTPTLVIKKRTKNLGYKFNNTIYTKTI